MKIVESIGIVAKSPIAKAMHKIVPIKIYWPLKIGFIVESKSFMYCLRHTEVNSCELSHLTELWCYGFGSETWHSQGFIKINFQAGPDLGGVKGLCHKPSTTIFFWETIAILVADDVC